jgi:hypothetical protein
MPLARCASTCWILAGCVSGTSQLPQGSQTTAAECTVRLPPRGATASVAAASPTRVAPRSLLVVQAEMPLSPLQQQLESRIRPQLAEGRVRIGPGGTITYSAVRGPLALSVSRTALIAEMPVQARAEACRGERCYASCEPQAVVRAVVPLMLRPDYRFEKAKVSARFTRGCQVRALGGFLTLDVTPTLEAQLEPELQKVARDIDRQLPDISSEIDRAWQELSKTRDLPLGACLALQPSGVVQGPLTASTHALRARFAVLATPELRAPCRDASVTGPVPALQTDLALPEQGVVHLGLVTPLASVARAWGANAPAAAAGKSFHVTRAEVTARGDDLDAELTLAGEICGDVALGASLSFDGDGRFIDLARPTVSKAETARLTESDISSSELLAALAGAPRVAPLLSASAVREAAPALALALAPASLDVSAEISSARPAGAAARGTELVAWLEVRGALQVKQK